MKCISSSSPHPHPFPFLVGRGEFNVWSCVCDWKFYALHIRRTWIMNKIFHIIIESYYDSSPSYEQDFAIWSDIVYLLSNFWGLINFSSEQPGLSLLKGIIFTFVEYSDVSAYRLSLSEDTKALNQLVRSSTSTSCVVFDGIRIFVTWIIF